MDNKEAPALSADRITIVLLAMLVLLLAFFSLQKGKAQDGYSADSAYPSDFSLAVEAVMPALVKVENEVLATHPPIAGIPETGQIAQTREGTGFFIDKSGLILTNYHVVQDAQALRVVTRNRRSYDAEVVGGDALTDVAVIRIKPDFRVHTATLGDSSKLKVGQWVIAMGNPLGLEFFTTAGIVSGVGPPGPNYIGFYDFIQVDVNIKPGNSGGPLLNTRGEVVGINNAYLGPGTGIGFAIPINRVREELNLLKAGKSITRGFFGMVGQPLTPGLVEKFGLKDARGSLVSGVLDDSPADVAGLKQGDVILEYDGRLVADDREMQEMIFNTRPGEKVEIVVWRDGKRRTLTAEMGELKEHNIISQRVLRQCGLTLKPVTKEAAAKFGLSGPAGLLVLKVVPGCPAYEGGLRFGDVILQVEKQDTNNESDFYRAYSALKPGGQVLVLVVRGGRPLYLTIKEGEGK